MQSPGYDNNLNPLFKESFGPPKGNRSAELGRRDDLVCAFSSIAHFKRSSAEEIPPFHSSYTYSVAFFTICFTVFDVLPENLGSPPYNAAILVVPRGSAEVTKLANPPLNDPVPSTVFPFVNEMVSPSGGAGVTTAEMVTA